MANDTRMKIAVVGAGAVGSLVGGFMALAGEDVTLIGKGEHVRAINENGLHIDGVKGTHTVSIAASEELAFQPDIIFLAVKTQDVEAICKSIAEKAWDAPVVLMQNGVRSADIAGRILDSRAFVNCIVLVNAKYLNPGAVSWAAEWPFVIGSSNEDADLVAKVQALLTHVTDTIITPNIEGALWTKLMINAMGNAMDAMTGLSLKEYLAYTGIRKISVHIVREALAIVERAGIQLEPLPGLPVSLLQSMGKLPVSIAADLLKKDLKSDDNDNAVSSTLQSLKRGKRTEIDYLNGEFAVLGQRFGLPVPYNTKVVEIVHEIERIHRFYTPDELIAAFAV